VHLDFDDCISTYFSEDILLLFPLCLSFHRHVYFFCSVTVFVLVISIILRWEPILRTKVRTQCAASYRKPGLNTWQNNGSKHPVTDNWTPSTSPFSYIKPWSNGWELLGTGAATNVFRWKQAEDVTRSKIDGFRWSIFDCWVSHQQTDDIDSTGINKDDI